MRGEGDDHAMCRLLAYLGTPVFLDALLRGQEHSLYVQSYKPREMLSGTVNADGFGVGFYVPEVDPTPVRYVSPSPIWADGNWESLARKLRAGCVLASVRSATDGMPFGSADTAPFARGPYLFMHNGYVQDFRRAMMRTLRSVLRDEHYAQIVSSTDSEHLFALFLECVDQQTSRDPGTLGRALAALIARVSGWARERGDLRALLNMVVSDGEVIAATRYATQGRAPSLYVREAHDGLTLASEPLARDAGFREVPEGSLVTLSREGVRITAL